MEPHKHELKVRQSKMSARNFTVTCEGCGKKRDYRKKKFYQLIAGRKFGRRDRF